MLVSEMMTKDVTTVTVDASLNKAFKILHEARHKLLPVVQNDGKLRGLVTELLLAEVRPSKATSLSVYEINYILSRTKVGDIMNRQVYTIGPDALVEDAALLMHNQEIGSLPVVEKDQTLVGIVTQTDIFKAFIGLMGVDSKGTRISLEVEDNSVGMMANITGTLAEGNINISHISIFYKGDSKYEIVLRVDSVEHEDVAARLKDKGYKIRDVRVF